MQNSASADSLQSLLSLSEEFELHLREHFPADGLVLAAPEAKHRLTLAACELSLEHARVLRAAFALAAGNTGAALLRLQYEALLRATWLLFAAPQTQLDKLTAGFDPPAEQAAKNLPGYLDMLTAVTKAAPPQLTSLLNEFSHYSRHALNSYVHVGLHPLHHAQHGFPIELAHQVVRFSNGLLHLAYRLLASLTGSQSRMDQVTRAYQRFEACLPVGSPASRP